MHVARAASRLSPLKPKMGAAIVKGGRVLAVGYNRPGSTQWNHWSRHAETTAIIAAGDCKGATIYVYREHGITGEPLMAKPCQGCAEAISLSGIRRVVYTQ
jgi:deoxycytidylate deaminase